jgi:hypothetical protein
MVLDQGVHVIQASRPGHSDVLVNVSYKPGAHEQLNLKLDELPGNIHVESDQQRAVVLIDGRDVGLVPQDITRPAGVYRIQVQKLGFVSYETSVKLAPGQKTSLTARLQHETESIVDKWWFWGGAAAVVAGGITATYFLTRPEPQPPDWNRGSLGWLAQPK